MIICINGKFVDRKKAKISVFDHGFLYGDGVFDTIAAYNGKIFWLEEHVDRLLDGCKKLSLKTPWTRKEIIRLAELTFKKNKKSKGRIRITITRGLGSVPIYDLTNCKPTLVIFSTKWESPPSQYYQKGIKLKTVSWQRFNPIVKNLNFLPSVIGLIEAQKAGFDDALFMDSNNKITEGSTFNIFMRRSNVIKTPIQNVLPGVTQQKVAELAKSLGLKVVAVDSIPFKELKDADEVFITGTTKRIVPVVKVDTHLINRGSVGPKTNLLLQEFRERFY